MGRPRWVALVAVLGAFMLVSAGCASDEGGGGAQSEDCSADQFGCLTLASGEPIKIGTLLSITGDNRSLGVDSQRAAYQQFLKLPGSYADHTIATMGLAVHIT